VSVSASSASVKGTSFFKKMETYAVFSIAGKTLVAGTGRYESGVSAWKYPRGGKAFITSLVSMAAI
jgi:hypothetical protein